MDTNECEKYGNNLAQYSSMRDRMRHLTSSIIAQEKRIGCWGRRIRKNDNFRIALGCNDSVVKRQNSREAESIKMDLDAGLGVLYVDSTIFKILQVRIFINKVNDSCHLKPLVVRATRGRRLIDETLVDPVIGTEFSVLKDQPRTLVDYAVCTVRRST